MVDLGGIILAGGRSSRMGSEKGMVDFDGRPMIAWILDSLSQLTDDILIVANDPVYRQFGYRTIEDQTKGMGPLAGLVTGLRHARPDLNFILGCDLPLVPPRLLEWMRDSHDDDAAVVCTLEGRIQPLTGLYHKKAIPTMDRLLKAGQLKMRIALEELQAAVLDPERNLPGFDPDWLRNFNSRAEIDAYLQGR